MQIWKGCWIKGKQVCFISLDSCISCHGWGAPWNLLKLDSCLHPAKNGSTGWWGWVSLGKEEGSGIPGWASRPWILTTHTQKWVAERRGTPEDAEDIFCLTHNSVKLSRHCCHLSLTLFILILAPNETRDCHQKFSALALSVFINLLPQNHRENHENNDFFPLYWAIKCDEYVIHNGECWN